MNLPINTNAPNLTEKDVKRMIEDLDTCPIKNSGTRVVYPVGTGKSGIFLIGEAPGKKEDEVGEPFVGAAGKFLNEHLLPSIGLNRDLIYLTNIVKCRPPENRDPTDQEKELWSPILLAEIIAKKPKMIVCLGRHSLSFFLPNVKISNVHGTLQKLQIYNDLSVALLPVYHPAAALYNPGLRETLLDDFSIIKKLLK